MTRVPVRLGVMSGLLLAAAMTFGQQPGRAIRATAVEDRPQSWALLVGVNAYAEIRPLKYCVADMDALRAKLVDAEFRPESVFLLSDTAAELKYKPTRVNILRQLELLVQIVGPKDTLVVAFSGHGVHMNNVSYFCPADANFAKPEETLVRLDKVYQMLSSLVAHLKVLLVDACRNDPFRPEDRAAISAGARGLRGITADRESIPRGIVLLSSCREGQQSWEDEKLGHGVFMHYLLKGLEGEADENHDNKVGLVELYHFAQARTKAHVARAHNAAQSPTWRAEREIDDECVVALVPRRISSRVEEARPAAEAAIAASDDPVVKSLWKQGNNFFATGEYDKAIQAYTNALLRDPRNASLYVNRGAAYRARGDIKMAVIDYQAAAQSLTLSVTEASALLRDGEKTTATVKQGQSLSVTKIEHFGGNDWLWVTSVDGNDAARGWIQMSAVEPKPVTPPTPPPAATPEPATPAGNNGGYDDDNGSTAFGMRAAENKLETLRNRYDRHPTTALERQIEAQERRVDRMRGR